MEIKICAKCEQELPITEFYFRKDKNRYRNCCKKCKSVTSKEEIKKRASSPTKICKHCGIEKSIEDYQKAGGGKWTQPYCKPCDSERKKKHWSNNRNVLMKKQKEYYENNKEAILKREKEKRNANKIEKPPRVYSKISEEERKRRKSIIDKIYREKNAEKILQKKKEYRESGRSAKVASLWQKRKMSDPAFRIKKNLRSRVHVALKRKIKSDATMNLLGCSIDYFIEYFQSKFTDGMTWELYLKGEIVIDHIKPCVLFDLTKEDQQRECFNFNNLQPLFKIDNLKKGVKYELKT